jgi:isopentenyl diphosphate isomerase/L-lactate dehydrogenase-like FMN-dependent dehydrogenase
VVASDLTPELLDRGRDLASAEGLDLRWEVGDAEALPYDDASFDAVISCVGVMFAPFHQAAADELVRVTRSGGRIGLIVAGGIRRGSDVVKAIALGATACAIGRPYLYGLAAAGQAGVAHVLTLFAEEMTRTMALLGVATVDELRQRGPELLRHRPRAFPS